MKRIKPKGLFYVYEHWRPDKDICFYVGKGKGRRAYIFDRCKHYNRIVAKLARLGMCVEVRLVQSGLEESVAFALEVLRIAFWRSVGVQLTNQTNGGEGASGCVKTEETKRKNSESHKGRKNNKNTIRLMQMAAQARWDADRVNGNIERKNLSEKHSGKTIPLEQRLRLSKKLTGRKLPEEHKRNIQRGMLASNYKQSEETKAKRRVPKSPELAAVLSARFKALNKLRIGKKLSTETRANMRAAHKARKERLKQLEESHEVGY